MDILKDPKITALTMAVTPHVVSGDVYGSYVLEKNGEYLCEIPPKQLMDKGCRYFGSSLKGRLDGTREVFGITRKAPISLDPMSGIFFLPTTSPHSSDCIWIAHGHVHSLEKLESKQTRIHFEGGKELTVDSSFTSLTNQIQRTAQFRHLMLDRITKHQREVELASS
ncbi:competence protein [Halalkalibacillus sediminis]|uniref:Competence protein n=1 Tax=Halalkalibacillus sediminis TaxID=2018042 RepID=A0A2I0QVG7_9BACI|nr:competence protein ComK [Halalkalibacillus sediminis]PKR78304.1 competence protein [Halalkalibacillus sediminis]